jgi:hypothetical protein
MTGLVNAAGAPEPSRVQSAFKATEHAREFDREKEVPILTGPHATARVLRSAVETIEFATSPQTRPTPEGEASDRFDQVDHEVATAGTLGRKLDLKA